MNLTDRREVKGLLDRYGLAPKKGRGQNFLANATVVNDIDGIIDCFGFNEISESEYERIVSKFYQIKG